MILGPTFLQGQAVKGLIVLDPPLDVITFLD